jgi:signal transduction histidine kinase
MASNCFQAVIGAIYMSTQCPRSLLTNWPAQLSRLRDITIPEVPRSQDPVTTLQEICAISQLTPSYAAEVSGPAHGQTSRSTLTIDSNAMRRRICVISGSVRGGKRPANAEAASIVLEVIDRLSDEVSIRDVDTSGSNDARIATFLVYHLATAVPDSETMTRKWMNARLFGTQLARKPSALMAWAAAADRLLGLQPAGSPNAMAITQLYRWAIGIAADQSSPIRSQVASMLQRLDRFGTPEDITNDDITELALLCDVYRARGSKLPNVTVESLSEDWAVLYGPRLQVNLPIEQITLTGAQRAALDSLSSLLLKQSDTVAIEFDQGFPVHVHMHGGSGHISRQVSAACSLWSAYDPMLDMTSVERGVDVSVTPISPDREPGMILGCVATALQPAPDPENSAIADLLHDLKNQLVAAKQALAAPSSSRTAQLAARASASGHLDQAVSMGRRLGAVSSLLGPPGTDATELRSFMRQYSMSVLSRLPQTISLVLPSTTGDPVRLALDEASLTAILDNLIKNGIEAMPSGGTIKLDWTSDSREAVIEVSDDGPGLPDAVADALESGAAVASTKPGGNGLGLRSVKTLLRRAGGEVVVSNTFGTTWLLSIPLAIEIRSVEES